jgi:hypothetical protein
MGIDCAAQQKEETTRKTTNEGKQHANAARKSAKPMTRQPNF